MNKGQTATEYTLLLGAILLIGVLVLPTLSARISATMRATTAALTIDWLTPNYDKGANR